MINENMQLLKVSENKRFLVKSDGSPFFWLGDTAWELIHKLNREESDEYLKNRSDKGFNVIQTVLLGEDEGLTKENAYGRKPLLKNSDGEYDPTLPDLDVSNNFKFNYWDHVDYVIDKAAELGLYIALLPTWGDKYNLLWGKGPVIFNPENAGVYGKWLGIRYKDKNNIIWVMGGDRPLTTSAHFEIVNTMAKGIREGTQGRNLMTFHPKGGCSSSENVHDEEWLDFNMIQSGHSSMNYANYKHVQGDFIKLPIKPTLDGEPRYEDHPINFKPENGYFDDYDARQAAYWAVFSGAFGHTYGHHSIWCMCKDPGDYFIMTYKEALNRPGAGQMQYIKRLMESRSMLDSRPDQSMVKDNYQGANYIAALRGEDYSFLYNPCGLKMKVEMGIMKGKKMKASWYNPRTGNTDFIDEYENRGVIEFSPPSSGRNNDWVLILDSVVE